MSTLTSAAPGGAHKTPVLLVVVLALAATVTTLSGVFPEAGLLLGGLLLLEIGLLGLRAVQHDLAFPEAVARAARQHTEDLGDLIHQMTRLARDIERDVGSGTGIERHWRTLMDGPDTVGLAYEEVVTLHGLVQAINEQDIPLTVVERRIAQAARGLLRAPGVLRCLRDGSAIIGVPVARFQALKQACGRSIR